MVAPGKRKTSVFKFVSESLGEITKVICYIIILTEARPHDECNLQMRIKIIVSK